MRRCLLLPIHYETNETLSFKVFEELENYLKISSWCYYQSNAAILEIMSPQKTNLNQYLKKENVLKIIAQKTNSGSLIRIELNPTNTGVELSMDVIGVNGSDIYLRKKTIFGRSNYYVIAQMAKNWLEEFQQTIPYDGLIISVLGDQFTIDIGSDSELFAESEVSISRPGKKKRHPLLKKIVALDSIPIGEGKIFQVTKSQGQGKIIAYKTLNKKLKNGDWIKIKEHQKREFLKIDKYKRKNNYTFGKIGEWEISFPLSTASQKKANQEHQTTGFGVEFTGELWITRKYWTSFTYGQKFGILNNQGLNNSRLRFKAGYRYLPLNFFHGPQINAFLGHGLYRYNLQTNHSISVQGFLLGIGCHLPLKKMFALNAEFGIIPSDSYSENHSGSNYHIKTGLSYWYNSRMKFLASYDFVNSDISLNNSANQINIKESRLKMGLSFIF